MESTHRRYLRGLIVPLRQEIFTNAVAGSSCVNKSISKYCAVCSRLTRNTSLCACFGLTTVILRYSGTIRILGYGVGAKLGSGDGTCVGNWLGADDGRYVGIGIGITLGNCDGTGVGPSDGVELGADEGICDGIGEGITEGGGVGIFDGIGDGIGEGESVGEGVGAKVGIGVGGVVGIPVMLISKLSDKASKPEASRHATLIW